MRRIDRDRNGLSPPDPSAPYDGTNGRQNDSKWNLFWVLWVLLALLWIALALWLVEIERRLERIQERIERRYLHNEEPK